MSDFTNLRKLEHIGIAVRDLEKATALYAKLLGTTHYKIEEVQSEQVRTSFFRTGETKIELLEPTSASSAIARFIEKRGPGVHHLAFDVADIRAEMRRLKDAGFELVSEQPGRGADNKLVCFVHPRSAHGVLIELCQEIEEDAGETGHS